jgi:chloramphenicol O-acetyltransferase type A
MIKKIDINAWSRKPQYDLFRSYEDPFFNITANVEVTNLVDFCKRTGESFFLNSLYIGAKINNDIDEFKLRCRGDEVIIHDVVNFGAPIMHNNKSFTFCYFKYFEDRKRCIKEAAVSLKKEKENPILNPRFGEDDVIHFSVLPWINFTSIKHARKHPIKDSIPKIVYGKYFELNGKCFMAISLELHHALMDGYHAGLFYEKWKEIELTFK